MEEVLLGAYRTERQPARLHPYVRSSNRRAISLDDDALKQVTDMEEAEEELVEAATLGSIKPARPSSTGASSTPSTTEAVPQRSAANCAASDLLTQESTLASLSSSVAPPSKLVGLPMRHCGVSDLFGDATLQIDDFCDANSDETALHNKSQVGVNAKHEERQQEQHTSRESVTVGFC